MKEFDAGVLFHAFLQMLTVTETQDKDHLRLFPHQLIDHPDNTAVLRIDTFPVEHVQVHPLPDRLEPVVVRFAPAAIAHRADQNDTHGGGLVLGTDRLDLIQPAVPEGKEQQHGEQRGHQDLGDGFHA